MKWERFKDFLFRTRKRKILFVIFIIVLWIVGSFLTWALTPLGPMDEALEALESDENVNVSTDRWLVFEPVEDDVDTAFIIYPGARVDHRSYAPLARDVAEEGFLVVIAPMILNLAVLSPNAASDVIDSFPDIDIWVIGGHSLGGVMAARYADRNEVDGLVLWASYPANDLSDSNLPAISIYGSNDGLTTIDDIDENRANMSPETIYVEIEGGNHAQFGWYGEQRGDNEASISREEQQDIIVYETVKFLREEV